MSYNFDRGFHVYSEPQDTSPSVKGLSIRFSPHFHPYASELLQRLEGGSIEDLLGADTDPAFDQSMTLLTPETNIVQGGQSAFPRRILDFDVGSAYGLYNWELFFHAPLLIGIHLSRNQRFEEARAWFNQVFNPGASAQSTAPAPGRFWQFPPFRDAGATLNRNLLLNVATGDDGDQQRATARAMAAWRNDPFSPHAVARYRPSAYMTKTLFAYLDNLIAWGDALFREDTRESINEALQIYVLAAKLLGTRPQEIPEQTPLQVVSYESLRGSMRRKLEEMEVDVPFDQLSHPPPVGSDDARLPSVASLSSTAFCMPPNGKMLSYWDIVADRLFKIRNSLNIEGIFRQLPLVSPPIDPGLLASARALGLDIASIVSGAYQSLPHVRFQPMFARAVELTQEVKSLGNMLLSAIEKKDAESLQLLRQKHEIDILKRAEVVRFSQLQEAIKQREAIETNLRSAWVRWRHFEQLLGSPVPEQPKLDPLDADALQQLTFQANEPTLEPRNVDLSVRSTRFDPLDEGAGSTEVHISAREQREFEYLDSAQWQYRQAGQADTAAPLLGLIPALNIVTAFSGIGTTIQLPGGPVFAAIAQAVGNAARAAGGELTYQANKLAKQSGYERREQDWAVQSNTVRGEINQLLKQLRAAQIREAIADLEWKNHQQQIKNAEEVKEFLSTTKITNENFYVWLVRETKALHSRAFALAFETAQKAQSALQYELGDPSARFLESSYLDGKQGLLSGEKLFLDLKRMELSYLEENKREYELTKHVSLLQLDPLALVKLRATGRCSVKLPEELFDVDGPGHYFRRLRSVSLSLPCVAGPYASVSCKLTQTKSTVRVSSRLQNGTDGYARQGDTDDRFRDIAGQVQSIVTSSGINDAGLFELTQRDERYLPFEGTGAVSEWELELPSEFRQFDYDTISDVVMHVRFTAREGGNGMRDASTNRLRTLVSEATGAGLTRLFSLRHEFPTEWARFQASTEADKPIEIQLKPEHYPYWLKGVTHRKQALVMARTDQSAITVKKADGTNLGSLRPQMGRELRVTSPVDVGDALPKPSATGTLKIKLSTADVDDVFLAVTLQA